MVLKEGEKIHVIMRRQFEDDVRRHFVGEVQGVTEIAVRVQGYAFVFDPFKHLYLKRPELRVRIFPAADSGIIITVIPQTVILEDISYQMSQQNRMIVTDGKEFTLDINEFGPNY
jgi:hypothetical protein